MPCEDCYQAGYNQGYENGSRDTNIAYQSLLLELRERIDEVVRDQTTLVNEIEVQATYWKEQTRKAYQRGFEDGSSHFNKPNEHSS